MKIKTSLAIALMTMSLGATAQTEKQPAFPGAEGFGRYVSGGRGGSVFHVTNLNDSGEGSLRWAINQSGSKIIVFDVTGTIQLQSSLSIGANTTIAGQTSPGGICVADYPVNITGNNVIVRYMRFRLGNTHVTVDGADGWDGFGGFDKSNWMIDHCSVSWSIDECLSVLGNKNTTVQWCLVAQSLVNAGHSKGGHGYGGNWGGDHASFHHNLLVHHTSRTPRLGPRPTTQMSEYMDMRNNVIYNFGGNGCYGGEGMDVNIVNNYYKPGPGSPTGTKGMRIAGIGIRTNEYVTTYPAYAPALHKWGHFYVDGNVNSSYSQVNSDNWTYGMYNQVDGSSCDGTYTATTKDTMKLNVPLDIIYTTTHSAAQAYEKVLNYSGASLNRDAFDTQMVADARNGKATYTGSGLSSGFINTQNDNKPANAGNDWNAWPTLTASTAAKTDSDGDGMPDEWEDANGLKKNDASDGKVVAANGYTNVENYLNSLVSDITTNENEGGTIVGGIETTEKPAATSEYDISPTTSNGDWQFENNFSITSTKGYAEGSSNGFSGIKFSRKTDYVINLPAGLSVTKVTIEGYCNDDAGTAYLEKLNDTSYGSGEYTFPSRTELEHASHTVTLETPATGTLSFRPNGDNQVVWTIKLYTTVSTGINKLTGETNTKEVIYTIGGVKRNKTGKGLFIINGKKVIK